MAAESVRRYSSSSSEIDPFTLSIARAVAHSEQYATSYSEVTISSSSRSVPADDGTGSDDGEEVDGNEDDTGSNAPSEQGENEEPVQPTSPTTIVVGRPTVAPSYVFPEAGMTPDELRKFVLTPAAQSTRFLCQITRSRFKSHKKYKPNYKIYIEDHTFPETQRRLFLWANKRKRSHTSCYDIGATIPDANGKDEIFGKVKSNFVGTNFTIYSYGRNPFKDDDDQLPASAPLREELSVVAYDPNMLGFKGPRKMTILMPSMTREGERVSWCPTTEADTLSARYKSGNTRDMLVLHNKSPQWNEDTQAFVLNFGGRVSLASVKNFQLVHDQDLDYIILQFGRTGADTFTMDFQYPLCPLQAIGMVLTSFDAKIACE